MKSSLFLPEIINVGFQKRNDTYTKKLAYIIYYDTKGVLRKEKSWQQWRDSQIPNQECENVPTEGFVLNKHAGGYQSGWNYRQSYCRIYDPRGFEFEITIDNLLYILEFENCIKGKGLTGEFIYAWNGTELILLPISCPEYPELVEYNEQLKKPETITNKDLVVGYTYLTKNNEKYLYLGCFDYYDYYGKKKTGKYHYFQDLKSISFETFKSIKDKFIKVESTMIPFTFSEIIDELENTQSISPIDDTKSIKIKVTKNQLLNLFKTTRYSFNFYMDIADKKIDIKIFKNDHNNILSLNTCGPYLNGANYAKISIDELIKNYNLYYEKLFNTNGKFVKYSY